MDASCGELWVSRPQTGNMGTCSLLFLESPEGKNHGVLVEPFLEGRRLELMIKEKRGNSVLSLYIILTALVVVRLWRKILKVAWRADSA